LRKRDGAFHLSIPAQLKALSAYALKKGWDVVKELADTLKIEWTNRGDANGPVGFQRWQQPEMGLLKQ